MKQKDIDDIDSEIADILRKILDWDYTAYHGDIYIINVDKAADELRKYFLEKLEKNQEKNIN